ncbi:MAG: lytic transglycosylase domain-containing protein [Myxococcales bacterium]|nr:lytic transglycosylase domain-containing protein [Myxococcales bacterium]
MKTRLAQRMTLALAAVALGSLAGTLPASQTLTIPEAPRVEQAPREQPRLARELPLPQRDGRVDAVLAQLLGQQSNTGLTRDELSDLAETVVETADLYDFDYALVLAVIYVESRFDAFAISPKQALGLMQILPSTGEWMATKLGIPWEGPQTLFDPSTNVQIGVAYLRELTDRYGRLETALAAYNWGPTAIDRRLARGADLPRSYAGLVMEALQDGSS